MCLFTCLCTPSLSSWRELKLDLHMVLLQLSGQSMSSLLESAQTFRTIRVAIENCRYTSPWHLRMTDSARLWISLRTISGFTRPSKRSQKSSVIPALCPSRLVHPARLTLSAAYQYLTARLYFFLLKPAHNAKTSKAKPFHRLPQTTGGSIPTSRGTFPSRTVPRRGPPKNISFGFLSTLSTQLASMVEVMPTSPT
jgi:hypothetical protein